MPKNIRLEMTPTEAVAVLRWLGRNCESEEIADVYYRLKKAVDKREPKQFNR
jgi:uncharacterized protein (DUF2267 family)